jgi:hypothetical protein
MRVHALTGGYPRTINVLCDHCLLRGYASGVKVIHVDTVAVCAAALGLKPLSQKPQNYVFPFPMRKMENPEVYRPGRARKKLITAFIAVLLAAVCILGGYLAYRLGLHEYILMFVNKLI